MPPWSLIDPNHSLLELYYFEAIIRNEIPDTSNWIVNFIKHFEAIIRNDRGICCGIVRWKIFDASTLDWTLLRLWLILFLNHATWTIFFNNLGWQLKFGNITFTHFKNRFLNQWSKILTSSMLSTTILNNNCTNMLFI